MKILIGPAGRLPGLRPRFHGRFGGLFPLWLSLLFFAVFMGLPTKGETASRLSGNVLAQSYFNTGVALSDKGQNAQAFQAFMAAAQTDPGFGEAFREAGKCQMNLGNPGQAIGLFSQAIRLDPKNSKAYLGRGAARKHMKDLTGAEADYSGAIAIDPGYANAYYNRGLLYRETGKNGAAQQDFQKAMALYSRSIEMNPNDDAAYHNRALLHHQNGDMKSALADANRALALSPGNPAFQKTRQLIQAGPQVLKDKDPAPASGVGMPVAKAAPATPAAPVPATPVPGPSPLPSAPSATVAALNPVAPVFMPDQPDDDRLWKAGDVPWQKTDMPVAGDMDLSAVESLLREDASREWDYDRYAESVRAAVSLLGVIYGSMSPEEEARFTAKWAPLRDFPSAEGQAYFLRLNPLLLSFIQLRNALGLAVAEFDTAWQKAGMAAGMDNDALLTEGIQTASEASRRLNAVRGRMADVVRQIEALGDPPNPLAIRHRKRKALDAVLRALPFVGILPEKPAGPAGQPLTLTPVVKGLGGAQIRLKWDFGDGQSLVAEAAKPVSHLFAREGAFKVTVLVTDAATGKSLGQAQAPVRIGAPESSGGQYVFVGRQVFDNSDKVMVGMADMKKPNWDPSRVSVSENSVEYRMESLDDKGKVKGNARVRYSWDSPPPQFAPGQDFGLSTRIQVSGSGDWWVRTAGLSVYQYFVPAEEAQLLQDFTAGKPVNLRFLSKRGATFLTAHYLSENLDLKPGTLNLLKPYETQAWTAQTAAHPKNPAQAPLAVICISMNDDARVRVSYVYQYDPTGARKSAEMASEKNPNADAGAEVLTPEQRAARAEREARDEAVDMHRRVIRDYEESLARWRRELAGEKDPGRRAQLNDLLIDAMTEISREKDLIASIQTGRIVHTPAVADQVQRIKVIESCRTDLLRLKEIQDNHLRALRFEKAARSITGLIDQLPPDEARELHAWTDRQLSNEVFIKKDTEKLMKVAGIIQNRVSAENLRDEAAADDAITTLEEIKFGCNTAIMVLSPFAVAQGVVGGSALMTRAPGAIATGYGLGTGYIEGGPRQALVTGLRFYSPVVDVAASAVDGFSADGFSGMSKNVVLTLFMRKGSQLAANTIMKGRISAAQPRLTWKEVVADANFRQAREDGHNLVKHYERTQSAFDTMVAQRKPPGQSAREFVAANARTLAGTPEGKAVTEALAMVESSYTAKMAMNTTRVNVTTKQGYNTHLEMFLERPVVDRTRQLMQQRGWNDFELRQIRHAANTSKVGMDHDMAVVERNWRPKKNGREMTLSEFQHELEITMARAYRENAGNRTTKMADWKGTTTQDPEAYRDLNVLHIGETRARGIDPISTLNKDLAIETGQVNKYKVDLALSNRSRQGVAEACRTMRKELDTKFMDNIPAQSPQGRYFQRLRAALDRGATDPRAGEMEIFGLTGLRLPELSVKIKFHLARMIQTGTI